MTDAPRTARRVLTAPAATDGPLLVVDDFRTHFDTPGGMVKAVDGVTFSLERGRTLGIVGESGSGKTVLARSIMGLLTSRNVVRSGSAIYNGQEIVGADNSKLRALWGTEMAMVFQDPMTSLNPVMKIGRQITEGLRYHLDIPKDEAAEQALQLLNSVGIPDAKRRLGQYPHELSGGMRQRVTIAIALACGPKLLFADEPTTALDVTVQAQILNLLNQQQQDRHMAMVLVTHDLGVVAGRTDEIAVMYAGQIVEKAPTRTLFANVRMPYTEALLKSIPKLEDPSHTRLQIIGGRPPDLVHPPVGCRFSPRCPYAQPKCHAEQPPLVEAETPGHVFRCWFPVGTAAGQEALERNLAHHVPAAEAAVTGDSAAAAHVEDEAAVLVDSDVRRAALMAGTGTAHLRADDDVLLRIEDLVVEFKTSAGTVHAVSGISLDVREGETLGLVGESGCGKSTTGRAIMQLPAPTSGQVLFEGSDLATLSGQQLREVRTRLQFIFQDPISSLNPRRKVKDIVAEPLRIWKRGTDAEQKARVSEVLDAVGLDPEVAAEKRPHQFSGGQCQRISIARSLVLDPKVIICDEPVSALDVSVQAQILNLLEDMKARYGLTLIFIAHDLAVVKNISDRVAVMYLGKICEVGTPDDLYATPAHPYTAALLRSIPVPDPAVPPVQSGLLTGDLPSPIDPPAGCRFRTRCPLAQERCALEEPQVRPVGEGHFVACHFPLLGTAAPEATPVEVGTAVP